MGEGLAVGVLSIEGQPKSLLLYRSFFTKVSKNTFGIPDIGDAIMWHLYSMADVACSTCIVDVHLSVSKYVHQ